MFPEQKLVTGFIFQTSDNDKGKGEIKVEIFMESVGSGFDHQTDSAGSGSDITSIP